MAEILLCPRHGVGASLEKHVGHAGRFTLDVCPVCGGIWFDKGEISKLTGEREVERLIVRFAGGRSDFPCPRCGETMATRPVGDVAVDVCVRCQGVWFDLDELETVVRTVGGEIPLEGKGLMAGGWGYWASLGLAAFASPHVLKTLLEPRRPQVPPPEKL